MESKSISLESVSNRLNLFKSFQKQVLTQLKRFISTKTKPAKCNQTNSISHSNKEALSQSPRILLVEDDLIAQKINKLLLKLMGCSVDVAINGKDAISKLNSRYDLIILDLFLPDTDGITLFKIIRSGNINQDIPIVALTGSHSKQIRNDCYIAGFNGFAKKPLDFHELNLLVRTILINANNSSKG